MRRPWQKTQKREKALCKKRVDCFTYTLYTRWQAQYRTELLGVIMIMGSSLNPTGQLTSQLGLSARMVDIPNGLICFVTEIYRNDIWEGKTFFCLNYIIVSILFDCQWG